MNNESSFEDTRPQPALQAAPPPPEGVVLTGRPARGGCGVLALALAGLALLALLIVGLATAAGYVSGQREGNARATLTQQSAIADQLNRIPQDVASGNTQLLYARLEFLSQITPGIPEVTAFRVTATALALDQQATVAPTPTSSVTAAAPTAAQPSAAPTAAVTPGSVGYDLNALLTQAQTAVSAGQYPDAIALLDAITGIDAQFQTATVRTLLGRALNNYASQLYNTYTPGSPGRLAEAIVLTDRAEQLGVLADGLAFERSAAQSYLDARRAIGLDPFTAIRAYERLYAQGAGGRYYAEAQQELFNQYVALGDAQVALNEHCPAAGYYQSALNYLQSSSASAKLRTSTDLCALATPVGLPALPGTTTAPLNLTPIAPLGVPGA